MPSDTHSWILERAKVSLMNMAIRSGILEKAKESVQIMIKHLFFDFDKIHVAFSNQIEKPENL